ncbi:MAG: SDR family oxidoreductase [Desulfuromonadales bacterium]|jgi:3-hydroxy acid dehydrogenase/malonic semialdehyde reductase
MGKTAFITGATSGFGKACAERFADAGWRLVLAARRTDRLKALQELLGKRTEVHVLDLDVRDREAVEGIPAGLPAHFRELDLLVNNAGLALGLEPAPEANLDEWETMVDTNIKGLMFCTRALLPAMVARNRGHIVNIGSVAGNWPYPGGNVYGGTKAFVRQFSHNLRCDLLGTRVRVTNIEPGLAETEFSVVRFKGDVSKAAQTYRGTEPLTAEDIAEAVFWVANLPERVNINSLEVMPTCQAWGPFAVHREEG